MNTPFQLNSGAFDSHAVGLAPATITASATSTAVRNGLTIDRLALARRYLSGQAIAAYSAVRESTGLKTHTIALSVDDSADGTNWTAYSTGTVSSLTLGATTTAAGGTNLSSALNAALEMQVNLLRARRYVRMNVVATISATSSGAEAGTVMGIWSLAGAEANPTT